MAKPATLLILIILFHPYMIYATGSKLVIDDYTSTASFSDMPIVRITNSDSRLYADENYDDSSWNTISLPSYWNKDPFPGHNGVCWYRLNIQFPG
jgi:hypothetical protein